MATQTFMAYWLGYESGGSTLEQTPDEVDIVALAFAVTAPSLRGDSISLDFLTSKHSESEMRAGAKALQARGVKVLMSINGTDSWEGHPNGWGNLKPDEFAANVKRIVMDDWGLDGIDLDNEAAGMVDDGYVAVVKALRAALGPDALITTPVFMGPWRDGYLSQVKDDLSLVMTMAYWNDLTSAQYLFEQYAALVGPEKLGIGVANSANQGQNTPIEAVPQIAAWNPEGSSKAGVMLWNLNQPMLEETKAWCKMIGDALP
jgi:chitinase